MGNTIKDGSVKDYIDSGTVNMTNKTLTSPVLNTGVSGTAIVDEDNMVSNSATKIPTQQSTKAYVDNAVTVTEMPGALPYHSKYLSNWFAKLKDSNDSGPLNIVIVGDSIASGSSTDSPTSRGWGWVLSDLFARKDYLSRYPDTPDVAQVAPDGWTPALASWGKTMTYCEGSTTNTGLGRYSSTMSNGQVAYHTATLDAVSVVYNMSPTGGQIEVRDGAGGTLLTTIETNGTAVGAQMWTSSALTYGSHTVHLTAVCGVGESVVLNGVYCYSGNLTRGIRVWPAARAGISTDTARTDTTFFLDFIDTIDPDLVVLATGANDDVADYTADMQALIDDTKARTSADIALWGCYPITRLAKYLESQSVLARNMALNNNMQIIDAFLALPDMRQGLYFRDTLHPNDKGVKILAWHAYSILSGDPLGFTMRELSTKAEQSSLDSLTTTVNTKAPIANPTFTGQVTLPDQFTYSNGNMKGSNFFGHPLFDMKQTGQTYNQISLVTSSTNSSFSGFSNPSIGFGAGTTTQDAILARNDVGEFRLRTATAGETGNILFAKKFNNQTGTSYTLALTDEGKIVTMNNASANTLDLPQDSAAAFTIGAEIPIINYGDGTTTIQAGTGATMVGSGSLLKNERKIATKVSANTWHVTSIGSDILLDEDDMASDSATKVPSQQSVKAYVDSRNQTLMADNGGSAISNTTTETTVQSGVITITAGTLEDGDTIELEYAGNHLNNSGGSINHTTRLKFNSTAVFSSTYTHATSGLAIRYAHDFKATRMSSTTLLLTGKFYLSNTVNTAVVKYQVVQGTECTVTVSDMDSNNLDIDMTFQWASASASATTTPYAVRAKLTKG